MFRTGTAGNGCRWIKVTVTRIGLRFRLVVSCSYVLDVVTFRGACWLFRLFVLLRVRLFVVWSGAGMSLFVHPLSRNFVVRGEQVTRATFLPLFSLVRLALQSWYSVEHLPRTAIVCGFFA